jgi:copper homeostasis protein
VSAAAARTGLALEIAVAGPSGARVAQAGGADRVELSTGLELGGLTPTAPAVGAASATGIPVHALIRCRPGDFVYDEDEIGLMTAEVHAAVAAGAAGVVVGALTADGELDREALARFTGAAREAGAGAGRPVEITLHRAIDQAVTPVRVAAQLRDLGIDRVLTSGGAPSAIAGAAVLREIVRAAPGVQVMAGAGVRPEDAPALAATGVAALHLSAKRPAPARRAGGWVPLGAGVAAADQDTHFSTDPGLVRAARAAIDALAPAR